MTRFLLQFALCLPGVALASPWIFGDPVTVAGDTDTPHYHHLDGAGRRHIAASDSAVAMVWEDDRSGAPQVYVAVKPHSSRSFPRTEQLSDGEEAYEPTIVSIDQGQWLAAWEQDGTVVTRVIDADRLGPVRALTAKGSRQAILASDDSGRIAVLWVREKPDGQLIEAAELRVDNRAAVPVAPAVAVSPVTEHPFQGYPAAVWGPDGRLIAAWEDRRAGHTRLFHAWRFPGQAFAPARQLNEHLEPTATEGKTAGLGSGAMRVSLALDEADTVRALWLDKRNPRSGYAVWGAASGDGGRTFGANEIVQDEFGDVVPQWHASIAGGKSGFVAAWDDTRENWSDTGETGDVLVSWRSNAGWSADLLVPGASGKGYQGSPAIWVDPRGDLHLIWIERDDLLSPTRLRYMRGVFGKP